MTLNALIVDDEPLALGLLESYVERTPFLQLAGSYGSAVDALEALRSGRIDLAFLDIQMPQLSGLELTRLIDAERTRVVFTTAFEQYALEGFRVDALDYLLKPISYPEFLRAANKALNWHEAMHRAGDKERPETDSIFVKSDYKLVQLELKKIQYIEGVKDYVRISTLGDDGSEHPVLTQMSLKTMEDRLPAGRFLRVHRSFIVNIDQIRVIERNRIVFGKTYIPISDSYKEAFMEVLRQRSIT
ncbi:MAG: response regulator transcription factor [Rikenellaceae bacterium]|nr:response regulator transcription factor [Rikenellaceae bacterium]